MATTFATPRVIFTREARVAFEVRGKKREPVPYHPVTNPDGPLPMTRDDGGLVHQFEIWLAERTDIDSRFQAAGGGIWIGTVDPEHAAEVEAWLLEHGGRAAT